MRWCSRLPGGSSSWCAPGRLSRCDVFQARQPRSYTPFLRAMPCVSAHHQPSRLPFVRMCGV
eukprot:3310986-Alexandrium_andersonii.AAC.1